ncbi:NADH-cytochrome b5 reductase-like [Teleopsis dalmanni]|uniref:NADH-cytochrome b5 reductase-like n=1 Tax=Teleopsis dalmanni TaxID=139649 RepID=UPI0018CF487A|nr:NADH-cytochrome b5 reductase-like [Teleopsis dalmanni]XP_037934833.1 NADH-cytochrome b5 reductase-like [Teleopsis dalmanni]
MVSAQDNDIDSYTESDCCGNGCVNCVLNVKSISPIEITSKQNILRNYTKFTLKNKQPHTPLLPDVIDLHFVYADVNDGASEFCVHVPPGHHIMMRAFIEDKVWLRPYSPFWVDTSKFEFKILVNLKPQGLMSNYIENLSIGDKVEFRGPIGSFVHKTPSCDKCIYIITQGVAIAPTIPIVEQILHNEDDLTRVYHLNCFTDINHIYFRKNLNDFNKYWNYEGHIYLAHQVCSNEKCQNSGSCCGECEVFRKLLWYKESAYIRRLTKTDLEKICCNNLNYQKEFIISGTKVFQTSISEIINEMNLVNEKEDIILL